MAEAKPRQCKLPGCSASFTPPKGAENKEFCCASHRYQFHAQERKAGLVLLRQVDANASQGDKS